MSKGLEYNVAELYPNEKCLSSSQVIAYDEDPAKFYEEYVMGIRKKETEPMLIGKVFSAMYADRKFKWREELSKGGVTNARIYRALGEAIEKFPVLPKKDCEYALKCKYRGWTFRVTLDGYFDRRVDIENKTGSTVWDQQRADESIQITMQYWAKYKKDRELFESCQVNWVDLRAKATKLIHTFTTHRTLDQIAEFEVLIDKVIDGIENGDWHATDYKPKFY